MRKMLLSACTAVIGLFISNQAIAATQYEAENATMSNGAKKNTNHGGYSGTGFVDGFYNTSNPAQVSFAVTGAAAGSATITLRYSAGNGTSTNMGLYVNGAKIKNITCNGTGNWDTWNNEVETVTLVAGNNTIAYKSESYAGACINIDYISMQGSTPTTYSLTVNSGGNGTTTPSGTVTVNSDVATSIAAIPASGYQFASWSVTAGTASIANAAAAATTVTLSSGNATIRANFTAIPTSSGAVTYAEISGPVTVTANNTVVLALPFTAPSAGYIVVSATGLYGTTQAYTDEQRGLESFITLNATSGGSLSGFVEKPNVQNGAQYVGETAGFQVSAGSNTVRLIVSPRTTLVSTAYKFVKCKMTVVFSQQKM